MKGALDVPCIKGETEMQRKGFAQIHCGRHWCALYLRCPLAEHVLDPFPRLHLHPTSAPDAVTVSWFSVILRVPP